MEKFVVFSHTHWDREWYMPFSLFRKKLVDLINRLLKLLEKDPSYIFHLDAQTVVLEDYLEIHPEKKELLEKYIASGNIRVGPWYLQNDFYLSSGEATVRNLLVGREVATAFGRCGKVGYVPDQFGIVSQMPQILAGFAIHHFIFGRGYRKYELTEDGKLREILQPCEFTWEGADGTQITTTFLHCWYSNGQRIPPERDRAREMLNINSRRFRPVLTTSLVPMMNGCDHLEAQDDLNEILADLRAEGIDVRQCGLDEYAELQDKELEGKTLPVKRGAMNTGTDVQVLRGCWSSRVYLKRANVRMQDMLEHKLEPLYAYLENGGFAEVYPKAELRYLWKSLLKNLPHDSVCGCSADPVHRHMENRYEEMEELAGELLSRGLQTAACHSGHPLSDGGNYCAVVFNPTARERSGVAECTLRLFVSDGISAFDLVDDRGNAVPYEIVDTDRRQMDIFSPVNLPDTINMDVVHIRLLAENVPALSAKVYAVLPRKKSAALSAPAQADHIENEYYRIGVENGKLTVTDLRTGKAYVDPVRVEDSTDRGDSYVYRFLPGEEPLLVSPTAVGEPVVGALAQSIDLHYVYARPAALDSATHLPIAETARMEITVRLTLTKGSDVIGVDYRFTNTAKNHRTRIALDSGITGGKLYTDSAFDVDVREPHHYCPQTDSDTQCNATFANITDEKSRFSVFTEGQHEVEHVGNTLYVTIVRATGYININHKNLAPLGGDRWIIPENQCLRPLAGRFGISYGEPATAADLYEAAKFFRCGFLAAGDSFDCKKYAGGRCSGEVAGFLGLTYLPDPYAGCVIPASFFTVDNPEIAVTCVKTGEKDGQIIRMVNLSSTATDANLSFAGEVWRTTLAEDADEYIGRDACRLTFGPKQIITLRLRGKEGNV